MKTFYLILMLSLLRLSGQEKVNTDILKTPASPASNLLDIATTDISKPTDVSDLMIGLRNFPINFINNGGYSIEIAPYWIFPSTEKDKTINEMLTNKHSVPQTFVISFAARNTDDSNSSSLPGNSIYTALGLKFSLLRGKADVKTQNDFEDIQIILSERSSHFNANFLPFLNEDAEYKKLQILRKDAENGTPAEQKIAQQNVDARLVFLKNEFYKKDKYLIENTEKLNKITFKINRIGFLWDFAGGTSLQFKEKRFNNSRIYNAGLWTVFGYAFEKSGTPLLLVRYMYNPKSDWMITEDFKPDGNFSTFDAGVKYEYSPKDSKFTGSFEGLYRSFISGSNLKPTWKCVLNLDYAIFPNQHLTLSLGKDFDNNMIKNGNVIAGLSFLSGIGTKRKIQ
ncbi:hypothetical protein OMO38_02615 [Chryseobacterium sp. 09-1422]|uniref:DUF3078 domain-containing protein n=1 Tax=Chryseobacterium kimseyorum TaxID=2984028 RepID=A0ABT3HUE7_9FLAO|nr:hypothetical protein [Chryseobacterium kimseyorum]MCW3167411.1 hypothetical protein [Chryseobacterium kimseyorum]